jgi:subtilase family serine protease
VFAASGDNDATDGGPNPVNVDVPSSCPHVIGCGGTTKTQANETVWNDNPGQADGEGTGGGFSAYFPQQDFQAGAPNGPGRMVPDVSANADDIQFGYQIVVHGGSYIVGGTSAVAPLYAGLFAAFGTKLGFATPKLWTNHLCFNDITEGDNGYYRARIGPDACTGIGSPIGTKLAALFVSPTVARAGEMALPAVPADWSGTLSYVFANGVVVKSSKTDALEHKRKRRRSTRA